MKSPAEQAMKLIYNLLNGEEKDEVVDSNICAIAGEWKYYEEYKAKGALQFLK